MSSQHENTGTTEKSGIRRAVALSTVDTEAPRGLTPASETNPSQPIAKPDGRGHPDPRRPQPAKDGTVALWESAGSPAEAAVDPEPENGTPGRRKTLVVAVIGGAALLSIPFLVLAASGHTRSAGLAAGSAAVNGLNDVTQSQVPGSPAVSASADPSPSASSSPSGRPQTDRAAPSPPAGSHSAVPARLQSSLAGAGQQSRQHTTTQTPSVPVVFGGAHQMLLQNLGTGLCADIPGNGPGSVNGPVDQYYCQPGSGDNQMWDLQVVVGPKGPGGEKAFTIRNDTDSLCMDLPYNGGSPSGTNVSEYYCDPTTADNQLWYLAAGDNDHYRIRNLASDGLCLGVTGGASAGHDALLQIEPCGSTADDWAWTTG